MRAYSCRGRQAVDLHDDPLVGSASVTTSLSSVGTKCWVLNSVNGSGVVTRTRTAASDVKRPSQ